MNIFGVPSSSMLLYVVISLLILSSHGYLHFKKHGGKHLIIRTILLAVALAGLIILFLRPTHPVKIDTKNVLIESVPYSLQSQIDDKLITLPKVNSVHDILSHEQSYDSIFIVGDGLSKEDLTLLDSFNLKYFPSNKLEGFVDIDFPSIRQNTDWNLKGKINQSKPHKILLVLNEEVPKETYTNDEGWFEFQMNNPIAGHFTYQISAIYEDTTISESLPIKVLPTTKWNLLALSSAPSFELNYLKNYWVKIGNGFSLRQQISTSIFKESFINSPKIKLDEINQNTLSKFNFLQIDALGWKDLKSKEQDLILRNVYAGRIALIFFGLSDGDELDRIIADQIESSKVPINQAQTIKLSKINTPVGFYNLYSNKISAASIKSYGIGSIGLMTTTDTYKYILAGQDATYQNIWAAVFSKLFISSPDDVIITSPAWNWENKLSSLNIYATKEIDSVAIVNNKVIKITPTQGQEGMFKLMVEPDLGWNTVKLKSNEKPYRFYAHAQDSWRAMNQQVLYQINTAAAEKNKYFIDQKQFIDKEISFIYGFILTLIGLGTLWLHERIFMS